MGSERGLRTAALALLLALGLARPAFAQEPDASTRVAARELAVSGAEAFDKQDYASALDRFQRAEALYKVPSIAVMSARCLARLGRVVEAVDKYEETLRMSLEPGAPEAFQRAVADASAEVEQARARVARLELRPPSNPPEGLEILLDGKPVPKALWSVPKPVDPGMHRVTARAPGHDPYSHDVALAEGARQGVEVTLLAAHPGESALGAAGSSSQADEASGSRRVGFALLAGGGVAIVAGSVLGIAALNHKSKLDDACQPGCPQNMSEDLDAFRRDRTLSYVGFGVGAAAAGLGAYFLLHQSSSGQRVEARLLPGGASLVGQF